MDQDTEVSPVLHTAFEDSGCCLLSSVEQAELIPICWPCVGQMMNTYVCTQACPLGDEERRKTPLSAWDRTKIWWLLLHFLALKPLHWAHVNCTEQLLPVEYIPVFHLLGNKWLVWEFWSKTSCLHCRGAWAITKLKLFHVCCFCKAEAVGVEKSMQSHVGFMMMLISCVLWLTFILSTLHPVILAYYCFCSCTMVVIEILSIAVSHN